MALPRPSAACTAPWRRRRRLLGECGGDRVEGRVTNGVAARRARQQQNGLLVHADDLTIEIDRIDHSEAKPVEGSHRKGDRNRRGRVVDQIDNHQIAEIALTRDGEDPLFYVAARHPHDCFDHRHVINGALAHRYVVRGYMPTILAAYQPVESPERIRWDNQPGRIHHGQCAAGDSADRGPAAAGDVFDYLLVANRHECAVLGAALAIQPVGPMPVGISFDCCGGALGALAGRKRADRRAISAARGAPSAVAVHRVDR